MHPLDQLLSEYNLSRNKFAQLSGLKPSTIGSYVSRDTPIEKWRVEVIIGLAKVSGLTTDEVIQKLLKYEEEYFGDTFKV